MDEKTLSQARATATIDNAIELLKINIERLNKEIEKQDELMSKIVEAQEALKKTL